jgi:hypothetical protein
MILELNGMIDVGRKSIDRSSREAIHVPVAVGMQPQGRKPQVAPVITAITRGKNRRPT